MRGGLFNPFFQNGYDLTGQTTGFINSVPVVPTLNLDTYFDTLNLQSNNAANFVTASGAITQWTDLSPSARHATQATTANKPLLTGGKPTFDGTNDFLQLSSEINLASHSIYVVYKSNAINKCLFGGVSRADYLYLRSNPTATKGNLIQIIINGLQFNLRIDTSSYYTILSLRKNGAVLTAKAYDRYLFDDGSDTTASMASLIGYLGRNTSGFYLNGEILAFCCSSTVFDDATDTKIIDALSARYSIPLASQSSLAVFGDSITESNLGIWPSTVAASLSIPYLNLGKSGSRLTTFDQYSGVTRYSRQLITRPFKDRICLLYGTNDIASGAIPASTFIADYTTIVSGLINAGYNPRNICLGSTPYQQSNANSSTLDSYRTAILNLATTYNTRYADILQAMRDGGGDTLMASALHPNTSGDTVIANTFITALAGA